MPKHTQFDKSKVLESLISLFLEKGYNGTSMQDIVDRTQLNRSSLYNTFGDKYQLYQEVLSKYSERQNGLTQQILSLDPDVRVALEKFLKSLFSNELAENTLNGCLLTKCALELSGDNGVIQELLASRKQVMIKGLEQVVHKGQQLGQLNNDLSAFDSALFIYNTIQGLRVLNSHTLEKEETASVIRGLFQRI